LHATLKKAQEIGAEVRYENSIAVSLTTIYIYIYIITFYRSITRGTHTPVFDRNRYASHSRRRIRIAVDLRSFSMYFAPSNDVGG
jgi:hypothetical protein